MVYLMMVGLYGIWGVVLPWVYEFFRNDFNLDKYAGFAYPIIITPVLFGMTVGNNLELLKIDYKKNTIMMRLTALMMSLLGGVWYLLLYPFVNWIYVEVGINSHGFNLVLVYGVLIWIYYWVAVLVLGIDFMKRKTMWLGFIVANLFYYCLFFVLFPYWQGMSRIAVFVAEKVIWVFDKDVRVWKSFDGVETLLIRDFVVAIGEACSGVMVVLLFGALYFYVSLVSFQKVNLLRLIVVGLLGMVGAYMVNVLRIVIIMLIGRGNRELALSLFHDQSTWIMMIIYFGVFWVIVRKFRLVN